MTDAKKLLQTAFSDTPPFFSWERWLGRKDQNPQDQRPRVLALGVRHDENVAEKFVIDNVKVLQSHNVVADFMETPYWFNPILAAYRAGVVTDEELTEHFSRFTNKNVPEYDVSHLSDLEKVKTLRSTNIIPIAVDGRWQTREMMQELERTKVWPSVLRANELAQQFPDSVKYAGFIEEALNRGLPADAITASLVSLHLSERKGNGILTYGKSHFVGVCSPAEQYNSQGILDDAMETQGLSVTHVMIVKNVDEFAAIQGLDQKEIKEKKNAIREGKPSWKACKDTADQMDFLYLYEYGGGYLLPKASFPKANVKDLFPASDYRKAEEVYEASKLDPTLVQELREKLTEAGITHGPNAVSLPLSHASAQDKSCNVSPRK